MIIVVAKINIFSICILQYLHSIIKTKRTSSKTKTIIKEDI